MHGISVKGTTVAASHVSGNKPLTEPLEEPWERLTQHSTALRSESLPECFDAWVYMRASRPKEAGRFLCSLGKRDSTVRARAIISIISKSV